MTVTIIGLGLIGGSIAIDLKKRGFATKIIGVDNDQLHVKTALNIGIIDRAEAIETAAESSDLIVIAIPADAALKLLPHVLDMITDQIVTDVSSTKNDICELIKEHPKRSNFVASHPMAGTEYSGPWAAVSHLFDGKSAIICNSEESSEAALRIVEDMYGTLNMRLIHMDARSHDIHAAYVSHISHISSFALALTVLDKEQDEKQIFNMAGGGFRSTVRLAKSSKEMWAPIFYQNAVNVADVIDTYIDKMKTFKKLIINKDVKGIQQLIERANKIKRII